MTSVIGKLKNRTQFLRVAASGKKWVTPGFILQVRLHEPGEIDFAQHEIIRVGYIVSKKVGGAVTRNRVKRRLRALVSKAVLPYVNDNVDCVLIGRKNAFDRPFNFMVSDMKLALQKLRVELNSLDNRVEDKN